MAYAVIEEGAEIGDGCVIYPYCYIGKNAKLGKDCELNPGAVVHENSILGDRVVLRAHAVVGGQGFGFSTERQATTITSVSWAALSSETTSRSAPAPPSTTVR